MEAPITELKDRCQSCGMPLKTGIPMDAVFLGTAADGSPVQDYCKFCYQNGAFTEPALTMQDMVAKSVSHMTRVLHLPPEKAKELAAATIPKLGRWQKQEV
ncbi:MAG TPA: zinc ribbon domain-containing protein [Candidatus Binatia bacterium]|nr:zinc ribbon domain-containing protein [Candidatus Binatia bacterium]